MSGNEAFDTAAIDVRKLTEPLPPTELLKLYGLYKVGTGADITTAKAPGMFSLQAKEMRKSWQKVVDRGISQEEAQNEYIELVEELKKKYAYDPNKEPEAVRS
ncbi:acyl-CoA-binding protein (ACBP)/diazepam binding inhibitor (DBI)/endozepine (EP) [Sporothrix eucalyptigena]|uniref:Acyl-CoA-binding protein (ACBP)/diazepam binding inhibitor (DBI)/endozepine (EP) n=1 Tax=Sporothrix eucalyptigena TaxID=1812306 RepID=A0ABP0BXH5_9PEZI